MKLSLLFAKFLYQHKELNLPGIGTFSIDPNIPTPDPSDKFFGEYINQIRYVQRPVAKPDEVFIDFIRVQTGKIRPLAESDLDSFLSDGKILLNIGKPFIFEGIGSLLKNRDGKYEFTPGTPLAVRADVFTADKITEKKSEPNASAEDPYHPQTDSSRKMIITLSILVGLAAVIWGGYYLYNRSAETNTETAIIQAEEPASNSDLVKIPDTTANITDRDTLRQSTPNPIATAPGTYRFIIESTTSKTRALKRYNQLKSYFINVLMDANADSSAFKLYFNLPASPSDTTRIKDSLGRMYARKVVIE